MIAARTSLLLLLLVFFFCIDARIAGGDREVPGARRVAKAAKRPIALRLDQQEANDTETETPTTVSPPPTAPSTTSKGT
uniref:Secreted protein n=1 Tax=Steinernema glaseri TaxID=37863 RepID=A0A1I7Y1H1_9BILA